MEVQSVIDEYLRMRLPARFTVIFYSYSPTNLLAKDFPMNLLRNIGIYAVRTSHFLMLDMDIWVSRDFHQEIQRIPPALLHDPMNLFILPIIFLDKKTVLPQCQSLASCVNVYGTPSLPPIPAPFPSCPPAKPKSETVCARIAATCGRWAPKRTFAALLDWKHIAVSHSRLALAPRLAARREDPVLPTAAAGAVGLEQACEVDISSCD